MVNTLNIMFVYMSVCVTTFMIIGIIITYYIKQRDIGHLITKHISIKVVAFLLYNGCVNDTAAACPTQAPKYERELITLSCLKHL